MPRNRQSLKVFLRILLLTNAERLSFPQVTEHLFLKQMAEHIVLAKPQTGTCVYMAVDDQVRGNAITDDTPVFRFIFRTFTAVCIDISGDCIVAYIGRAESKFFSEVRFPSFPAEKC